MRTRSRTYSSGIDPGGSWTSTHINTSNGDIVGSSAGSVSSFDQGMDSEIITDNGTSYGGIKKVVHTRERNLIRACPLAFWYYDNRARKITINGKYRLWTDLGFSPSSLSSSNLTITFPKTIDQLKVEALKNFYDKNEADNLLNIIEMGQTISGIRGVLDFLSRLSSRRGVKLLDLSNTYLASEFGFRPLISDLRKTYTGMRNIRSQLKRFRGSVTRDYTVTARCVGDINLSLPNNGRYSTSTNPNDGTAFHCNIYRSKIPVRIVGVSGKRYHEYKSDTFQVLDYMIGRFVATGPVSLAWEKLKFSFVFDWFVDISSILNTMDNALTGSSMKVKKCWWSEAVACYIPTYFHKCNANFFDQYEQQQVALFEYQNYHREALVPDISVVPSGRFGKKQASLSLALINQMVANLRR